MFPAQINLGPLGLPTFGFFAAFAFILASFLIWRKLREDYPEEEILTFTIWLALVVFLGGRLFYLINYFADFGFDLGKWLLFNRYPGFSFVGSFLGGIIFSFYWVRKKNWDFWIIIDNLIQVFLFVFLVCGLGALLEKPSFAERIIQETIFLKVFFSLVVLLLSFLVERHFRKFIWYKSGKPGFTACFVAAVYFLVNFGLDFFRGTGLYWEKPGSLMIALGALFFLYYRSGRVIQEDFQVLGSFFKGKQKKP